MIHLSAAQALVQIAPIRIFALNQRDLPIAFPTFQIFFTLNRLFDVFKGFKVHERLHAIALRESFNKPFLMLVNAAYKVVCYPDIKCAVSLARQDVNVVGHGWSLI